MIYIVIASLSSAISTFFISSIYIFYLKQRIYELESMNDSLMEVISND